MIHPLPLWSFASTATRLKRMAHSLTALCTRPRPDQGKEFSWQASEAPPGFRGQHALVRDPKSGHSRCIGCLRCVQACPSGCIRLQWHKDNTSGSCRQIDRYELDALRCSFCGYCVEVCPVNALVLTEISGYSSCQPEALVYSQEQLLAQWDRFIATKEAEGQPYTSPWWHPLGMAKSLLPAGKRHHPCQEAPGEKQVIGTQVTESRTGRVGKC